ncbi:MAG: hypothetical protein HEQ35_16700 [Gloeotrichia echinulata IR180]
MKIVYRFLSTSAIVFLLLQVSSCNNKSPNTNQPPITISPQPNFDEQILGRWYGEYTYTDQKQNVTISLKGTSEYFPNKRSNTDGEFSVSGTYEQKNITITYNLQTTGTWLINKQDLTETTDDIKSSLKSITYDGITLDREKITDEEINKFPKPEDLIPRGISSSSKILSLTSSQLQLEQSVEDQKVVVTYYKH